MPIVKAADGVELHYDLHDYTDPWKRGPVLILQHGFGRSSRFWYNMVPYIARHYPVVCPNLRGLGPSPADFDIDKAITVDNYIGDLVAIIESLGRGPVHYAGESLGGILGFALAAEHPELVRTLSVFAAPLVISAWTQKTFAFEHPTWQDALGSMGAEGWARAVNTATRFPPDTDPDLLEWFAREMGKSRVEVMIAMSRLASKVDATPSLSRIKAPVLGLYPSGGAIVSGDQEETLRARIADLTVVHLPTRYHMVHTLFPATCAEYVLSFMALHDGRVVRET
ncbi:MAG: alpha/beta hydrolase [Candidatus Rokubacteria bacterium]|nr:alpha/beta hydrolase [Candidatus Rokubacteria bacterium]